MKKWHKIFIKGVITASSPEEMKQIGISIGQQLSEGEVIGIAGNLGAGKTHLSQGIMEGLESGRKATSPTFSIVHEHTDGKMDAYHFDFYRLKGEHELYSIGWEDYLDRNGVIIVEWADMFPQAMPPGTSWILITHAGERERTLELKIL